MDQDLNSERFFALLRFGLEIEAAGDEHVFEGIEQTDWRWLYELARNQNMTAVALDGLSKLISKSYFVDAQTPPKDLKMKWIASVIRISEDYKAQWKRAVEFSDILTKNGIRVVILKGRSVARYYPVPDHRPSCDVDCFLFEDYETGNRIAEEAGATVVRDYYKHTQINFKGLVVENHRFCTSVRGSRRAKAFESELRRLLNKEDLDLLPGCSAFAPAPLFTALLLAEHARGHLISEGITLRHVCDWAMLLRQNSDKIDWREFIRIIGAYDAGLLRFVRSMTRLAFRCFHTPMPDGLIEGFTQFQKEDTLLLNDLLSPRKTLSHGFCFSWRKRIDIVSGYWKRRWSSRYFGSGSLLGTIRRSVIGFLFDRNPEI